MQKKRSKNLRKNISETWKTWRGKSMKRERSDGENCQEDLWQGNYMDGQTNDMTKNTREEWRKTGDNRRIRNLQEEKQ